MKHNLLFLSLLFFSVFAWSATEPLPDGSIVAPVPGTPDSALPANTLSSPTVITPTTAPTSAVPITPAQKPIVNEVQVAVLDESSNALQLGLQAAFSEVMIKMTGDPKVMDLPAVKMVASNITQIVQSYSFSQETSALPPSRPSIILDVVFNPDALQQLMQLINKTNDNAPTPPVTTQVKLLVTGVKNMADYTTLMQTLRATSNVNTVTVNSVDPDRIALTIDVNGGSPQLKAGLTTNAHLKPLVANTAANETELFYLWTN
ncbi:MAG: DUF2066 domain-containing protein [Coxiellaceae bacterium]|nr:DUF2066 domain-containing protein [Coxiellaceae bacterium]